MGLRFVVVVVDDDDLGFVRFWLNNIVCGEFDLMIVYSLLGMMTFSLAAYYEICQFLIFLLCYDCCRFRYVELVLICDLCVSIMK